MTEDPFPSAKYPTVEALCLAVFKGFSREMLLSARDGHTIGDAGQPRPLEASFQDEWYRSYWRELGTAHGICSEFTACDDGRIDFQIGTKGWGIELLRDGDRVEEHCSRFRPDGTYHRSISRGDITNWVIVDCRHSYPQKKCKVLPLCPALESLRLMLYRSQ